MTSERWQRIEALYHSVVERPPNSQEAFLSEACRGDEELRREVESLLRAKGSPEDGAAIRPGARLAVYRIETAIGAGGMGVVHRGGTLAEWAKQIRPWRQTVELLIGVGDALAAAHSANILPTVNCSLTVDAILT